MAIVNKKISELTTINTFADNDLFLIDQKQIDNTFITKAIKGSGISNSFSNVISEVVNNVASLQLTDIVLQGEIDLVNSNVASIVSDYLTISNAASEYLTIANAASYALIGSNVSSFVNDAGYLTVETDPIFVASNAFNVTAANMLVLNNTSGVNTGNQDLSPYALIGSNVSSFINDSNYIDLTDLSGGIGISYSNVNGVITNSSPDQVVSIGNSEHVTIGGTYPNFTLTDTAIDLTNISAIAPIVYSNVSGQISWTNSNNYAVIGANVSSFANDAGYITTFTETDPIFVASNAHSITLHDIQTLANTSGINTGNQDLSSYVDLSSVQTITNKRITKRVVPATDATSITPNTDNADWTYQLNTQALGTLTINADAGTPTNVQAWGLKIKSTNVQTFSWTAGAKGFAGGTNALPTATSGSGKIDYFVFIFDTVNNIWHYTGSAMNF